MEIRTNFPDLNEETVKVWCAQVKSGVTDETRERTVRNYLRRELTDQFKLTLVQSIRHNATNYEEILKSIPPCERSDRLPALRAKINQMIIDRYPFLKGQQ